MINFLTRRPTEEFAWDYANRISENGGAPAGVLSYEDLLERTEFPRGVYVFTGLNRFGPMVRKALTALFQGLGEKLERPPMNHPSRALGRYELLKALYRKGLNAFDVRGAWEDLSDLRYPVFVRDRSQDGGVPRLLASQREVEEEVGWAIVRGAEVSELLVVEFLDTSGDDNLFRKYSAYIVGDRVLPVSLDCGRDWVLRFPVAEFTRESIKEELDFVFGDPHADQLREVREVSQIDFGRIDYSLHEGRVQTWEINTFPTMRLPAGAEPLPPELRAQREPKMEFFKSRFREVWREIGGEQETLPSVKIDLPKDLVGPALGELSAEVPGTFPQPDRYSSIKAVLRPMKPLVMPLATKTVIPIFAKGKMRKAVRDARKSS